MIVDNQYWLFKEMVESVSKLKGKSFTWQGRKMTIEYAKSVVDFVESKGLPEYERFIDREAEKQSITK